MTNSIVRDVKISASLEIASRNLRRMASSEPNNCPKIFCDQLVTRWLATGHRTAQFSEFWKMLVLEPPLKLNFNAKKHFTTFLWPECDHQVTWKSSKYPTSMNFFSKVPGFAGLFPQHGSQTRSKFSKTGSSLWAEVCRGKIIFLKFWHHLSQCARISKKVYLQIFSSANWNERGTD